MQERERREYNEREAEKERKKLKQSQPGFDGRWYTDANSHLQHNIKYSLKLNTVYTCSDI